ncbi:MAG: class I SAM-dependent methyltransferase [Patescibacteria group bacterium]|jgi:SAM-dependent methyltransferase
MWFLKKIKTIMKSLKSKVIPDFIRLKFDAEEFSITKFVEFASKQIAPTDKILDAGAGSCPYKKYFNHASYESTDFENIFDKSSKNKHTFICSLDNIPKSDESYDAILNTQVLEHVEYPQKVIKEFFRILRPGGKLFLTAPQGWGIHGDPYHFFNFTKYGLKSLFINAGFTIKFIKPRGGIFWYLGKRIKMLPLYIFLQHIILKKDGATKFKPTLTGFLLLPFYILSIPICSLLIPLLFFYLDKLDKKQDFTLGYACYCEKK